MVHFPLTEKEKKKIPGIIDEAPKRGGCLSIIIAIVILSSLLIL